MRCNAFAGALLLQAALLSSSFIVSAPLLAQDAAGLGSRSIKTPRLNSQQIKTKGRLPGRTAAAKTWRRSLDRTRLA